MTCPTCGSPMRSHVTAKGAPCLVCERWKAGCKTWGSVELFNLLTSLQTENRRQTIALEESRHQMVVLLDKYAEARGDRPPQYDGKMPVSIGELVPGIARVGVARSQHKANGKREPANA